MKDPEIPSKDDSKTALTREHERQRRTDASLVFCDESAQQRWRDLRRRCQQQEHAAHAAVDGRQRYAYAIQTNMAMDFAADVAKNIQIGLPEAGSSSSDNERSTAAQLTPELVRRVLIDVMEYQRYSDIDLGTCDMGFNMLALAGWKYSEEFDVVLSQLITEETAEYPAS